MTPLDAAALVLIVLLPFHWLVLRHFRQMEDPAYLCQHGVIVESDSALESRSAPIGRYMGRPIWGDVRFMGMQYRFDRVVPARECERIGAGELFLAPGLVYVLGVAA